MTINRLTMGSHQKVTVSYIRQIIGSHRKVTSIRLTIGSRVDHDKVTRTRLTVVSHLKKVTNIRLTIDSHKHRSFSLIKLIKLQEEQMTSARLLCCIFPFYRTCNFISPPNFYLALKNQDVILYRTEKGKQTIHIKPHYSMKIQDDMRRVAPF